MIKLQKVSWRSFRVVSNVADAISSAAGGREARVELVPGGNVRLPVPAYSTGVGNKAAAFAATFSGWQSYRVPPIKMVAVPFPRIMLISYS